MSDTERQQTVGWLDEEPGVTYYYRVRAMNAAGASAPTSEATATTPAIASVSAPPAGAGRRF